MFDTGWVAAPVEPSPPLECGGEQCWDDDPGWATLAELDWNAAAEDAAEFSEPGELWAVPGICAADSDAEGGDSGGGRLSRATLAALAETAAAWEALRRVQARCYRR
jgi:hypothetical protein